MCARRHPSLLPERARRTHPSVSWCAGLAPTSPPWPTLVGCGAQRKREDALHARPWDNDFDGLQAAGTAIVTAQESLQDAMKKADDMLKGVTSMRVEELDAAIKGAVRAGVNGGLVSEASDKLERVRAMAAEAATISTCAAWCEPQFEMSKTGNLCANADCGACGFCDAAATQLRAEDAYGASSPPHTHPPPLAPPRPGMPLTNANLGAWAQAGVQSMTPTATMTRIGMTN